MRWHYNLIAQESGPLVRDVPVYDASDIIKGQALTYGATTRGAVLIDAAATAADIIAVSNEKVTASTTDLTTGTIVYCKAILNPDAVYLAQYDDTEANDIDVVSATTTAITLGSCDDDLDGSWIYVNSGTGQGQLVFIGAASSTVMTLDTTSAMAVCASDSDVILIRKPWKHAGTGGKDLDSTFAKLATDEDETGEIAVLENYIEAATIAHQPLRPGSHHALENLHNQSVKFYSDIYFTDHCLRGASTWT